MIPLVPLVPVGAVVASDVDSKYWDASFFAVYDSLAAFQTYSGTYISRFCDFSAEDDDDRPIT